MFAKIENGAPVPLDAGMPLVINQIQHPANILEVWTEAELKSIGIYTVKSIPVPDGQLIGGSSLQFDGADVHRVDTYVDPPAPPVPRQVTRRQIRRALDQMNILTEVKSWVSQASTAVQIDWEDANHFRRDYSFIEQARLALGFSQDQVDDLFRLAATFE